MSSLPPASAATFEPSLGGLSPTAFSSLFQAVGALRNGRALSAMLGCTVVGVLLAGVFTALASHTGFFMAFLGGLALLIASAAGINAAGVLLMEQARGVPQRGWVDAVVFGLTCIPKVIVLWLALMLVGLLVILATAIAYFICKIPFLGPLLFVAVFPLSVVIAGLTFCGLSLCLFLALPAIWEGATISRAVAQAFAIARNRLVESILLLAVVWILALAVGLVVFGVLFTGLMPMIGLSATILGGDVMSSMAGMMQGGAYGGTYGYGAGSSSSGHVVAAAIGSGLLWSLAGSLVSLVYLMGLNLVYLRVVEGIDSGSAEASLRGGFDQARRQAVDLGQKAKDAAERAREQTRTAAAAAQARAAANAVAKAAETTATQAPDNDATVPPAAQAPRPVEAAPPLAQQPAQQPPPHYNPPPAYSYSPPSPAAPTSTAGSAAPPSNLPRTCPHCLSPVSPDDMFCGVCGYKLK